MFMSCWLYLTRVQKSLLVTNVVIITRHDFKNAQVWPALLFHRVVYDKQKQQKLQVIYQSRKIVFHRDIHTPRRELKIRRAAEYFWRHSRCLDRRWNSLKCLIYFLNRNGEVKSSKSMLIKPRFWFATEMLIQPYDKSQNNTCCI